MMLRLLENTLVGQKIASTHFYSCPQAKLSPRFLSSLPQAEGNYSFHPNNTRFLENLWFLENVMTMVPHIPLSRIKSTDN